MLGWLIVSILIIGMYIMIYKYQKRIDELDKIVSENRKTLEKHNKKIAENRNYINKNYEKLGEHHNYIERMWVTIPKKQ